MKNIIGIRFGRLVVVSEAESIIYAGGSKKRRYICQCDCGTQKTIHEYSLTRGLTKSCGCFQKEQTSIARTSHGRSKKRGDARGHDKLHNTWSLMVKRCHDKSSPSYLYYGARGIYVCERWREDVSNFIADMGIPPSPQHSIERIDNNGSYCKENCVWATRTIQARNTRNAVKIEINGALVSLTEIAERSGINYTTLWHRVKAGWKPEDITKKPLRLRRKHSA